LFRFRSYSPFRLFAVYNKDLWNYIQNDDRVLIHHRIPTSTPNAPFFNHPISNEEETIHLIHNGVVWNDTELFNKLKSKHKFDTYDKRLKKFTDSEVIIHLF